MLNALGAAPFKDTIFFAGRRTATVALAAPGESLAACCGVSRDTKTEVCVGAACAQTGV